MRTSVWVAVLLVVGVWSANAQPALYHDNTQAVVYLADHAPPLDGNAPEWANLQGSSPTKFVYGGTKGENDPSAVFTLWSDNKTLYVRAEVTDANANENPLPAPLAWRDDSVEIFFGVNTSDHSKYLLGDSQIRLVPRSRSDIHAMGASVNDRIVDTERDVKGEVHYTGKGYLIVAAIPLRLLQIKGFQPGQAIRADFQINDATEGERENMAHWHSKKDDGYYDASSWGDGRVEALPEGK